MNDSLTAVLAQYGALGVMTIMAFAAVRVLFGRLQNAYDREKERADRLEAELQKLNETVRGEYINTISHASQAITDATRAVSDALLAARKS